MNPLIDELLANLELEYETEPQDFEDEEEPENDEEDSSTDLDAVYQVHDSLAGAIVNHYHKLGLLPNPNDMMPVAWHMEMGPAFDEAQAEANANAEGADSSGPSRRSWRCSDGRAWRRVPPHAETAERRAVKQTSAPTSA